MDMANDTVEEFSRERLMDDVRQYSCLYDKYCKDYQDKNVKNSAWAAVAAKYGITPAEAEKKYKTIRSSYTRYLKRKRNAPAGSRNADAPTPIAFQNLDWLASHIDHKETSVKWVSSGKSEGYLNEYSPVDEDDVYRGSYGELIRDEGQTNGVDDGPLSSMGIDSESVSSQRAPSQVVSGGSVGERSITMYYEKPKAKEETGETVLTVKPLVESRLKRKIEHDDEDELFCLSLAANLKRLSPRSRAIAKMRFQQVVFELEFPASQSDQC